MKKKTAWNKGLTKETDKRVLKYSGRFGKNNSNWKGGKPKCLICGKVLTRKEYRYCRKHTKRSKATQITKDKMSEVAKKRFAIPENHPNWKGGVTPLGLLIRNSWKYRQWRSDIFGRDNYTCQKSHIRGGILEAHHIKDFADILKDEHITTYKNAMECEKLWDINNGITLCKKCHNKFHKKYGKYNNATEQLIEFLK